MTDAEGQQLFRFAKNITEENARLREELLKTADVLEAHARSIRRYVAELPPVSSSPAPPH